MISLNFPKIGYDFGVRTASGARDYEIFPKIVCVFRGVRAASGAQVYEIFPKIGYVFGVRTASGARDCEIFLKDRGRFWSVAFPKCGKGLDPGTALPRVKPDNRAPPPPPP